MEVCFDSFLCLRILKVVTSADFGGYRVTFFQALKQLFFKILAEKPIIFSLKVISEDDELRKIKLMKLAIEFF